MQLDVLKRKWEDIKIKRPRREIKLPIVLSLQEVERLISVASNLKHRAILALTYSSGLRKSEIRFLKISAIDSDRMQVYIRMGKGKKDRYTILSVKTLELLRRYFKADRPRVYLFESSQRKGYPLSASTYHHIVTNNAVKAGITKEIGMHTLRHSFATHLLEAGVNIKLIQQYMGHRSLRTTSCYLHLTNNSRLNVKSPLDDLDF